MRSYSTSPASGSTPSVGSSADESSVDDLVRRHLPLVGYAVREAGSRIPGHVNRDDLTSAGMMALVQAAQSFDATKGAAFPTYASTRIRGAIVDELRGMDWASRSVRRRARQVEDTRGRLAVALGRPADDSEVASALGIGTSELAAHRDDVARASVVSLHSADGSVLDDLLPAHTVTPADEIERRERTAYLHDAVAQLPERLRVVVEGYFFRDLPMADLAAELGVSESRISQLRAEAIVLMKGALTAALEPELAEKAERPNGCAARRKEAYYASVASSRTYAARLSHPHGHVSSHTA